jgi:hypothetical protein
MDAERGRFEEAGKQGVPWKKWGPYLSERQWGTVREREVQRWTGTSAPLASLASLRETAFVGFGLTQAIEFPNMMD